MEIAKDFINSLRRPAAPLDADAFDGAVAWPELHARLSAAHAAAGELARGRAVPPAGGFGLWQSAGGYASRSVNPTGLADGKSAQGMDGAIAGETMAGGRGQ